VSRRPPTVKGILLRKISTYADKDNRP